MSAMTVGANVSAGPAPIPLSLTKLSVERPYEQSVLKAQRKKGQNLHASTHKRAI
jgi:hypothetical protein